MSEMLIQVRDNGPFLITGPCKVTDAAGNVFDLKGKEHTISRALVLLEDWQSGHYLEVDNNPIVNWSAGDTVEWIYDTPHMAANLGLAPRYTLQITGHL